MKITQNCVPSTTAVRSQFCVRHHKRQRTLHSGPAAMTTAVMSLSGAGDQECENSAAKVMHNWVTCKLCQSLTAK